MIALIDFDSIIYKCVYKVVTINQMRDAIELYGKENAKQWLNEQVYNEGINRCENELIKILNHLDSIFLNDVTSVELFITTCWKSYRKELSQEYKAKRKKNNYVWMIREHYKFNGAFYSETHEADDLIAYRAKELGKENYIVVSIDKDLKQIGGYYWSYLKEPENDTYGNVILNEYGQKNLLFKYDSVDYITEQEAERFFWMQMLMGDAGDGIKGLKGVGLKNAQSILNGTKCEWVRTAREYISRGQKNDFYTNYKLLKLG